MMEHFFPAFCGFMIGFPWTICILQQIQIRKLEKQPMEEHLRAFHEAILKASGKENGEIFYVVREKVPGY